MLWLTWRQHRWQLTAVTAVVALYWGYLLYGAIRVHRAMAGCPPLGGPNPMPPACETAFNTTVNDVANSLGEAMMFGNLLPLAAGMFWGAPLISRELEQGTYRLAFLQSASRRRWLAVKLGVLTGAAALLGAITGAVVTWSQGVLPFPQEPFGNDVTFSQSGIVPAATWVFALLVGVTAGLLLRRTTAAIAVTLVALPLVFAALLVLRPHYLPPADQLVDSAHMISDPSPANGPRGWLFQLSYVDQAGRELGSQAAGTICADPANTFPTADCLQRTGLRQRIVYQPADRYRWFQLAETGLLLTVSAALVLTIHRRVTRDLG